MALQAVGLKTQIWNNNLKSIALLALYPFLLCAIAWVVALVFHMMFVGAPQSQYISTSGGFERTTPPILPQATDGAWNFVFAYWPMIFTAAALWFIVAYFFQTKMIQTMARSHPVSRTDEPQLYNMLENLCIAAGMKMPRLEIIESHARNAFASGVNDKTYAVTVTRGLLNTLSPDEVEAVLAHELTHIKNHDVRLLIVSIIFTGMIGFVMQMVWGILRYNLFIPSRRGDRSAQMALVLLAVGAVLWIGYMATLFTRFAISRRREFMADAGAVEMTKNPDGMMRALLRIAGADKMPQVSDDIALMCIENSRPFLGFFKTHPPIDRRVQTISLATGAPIPDLRAVHKVSSNRFGAAGAHKNPWITAQRKFRRK